MRVSISHLQLHCNCKKKIKQNKANTIKLPSHSTNLKEKKGSTDKTPNGGNKANPILQKMER